MDDIRAKSGEEVRLCYERLRSYQAEERARQQQEAQLRSQQEASRRYVEQQDRAMRQSLQDNQRRQQEAWAAQVQKQLGQQQAFAQGAGLLMQGVLALMSESKDDSRQQPVDDSYRRAMQQQQAEQAAVQRRAEEAQAKQRRDEEESSYATLVNKAKEVADIGRALHAFAQNPFGTTVDAVAGGTGDTLTGGAVSASTGLPRYSDERYAAVAAVNDEVRGQALASNPFASEVTRQSLGAVGQVHQGALGELEQVTGQIRDFKVETRPAAPLSAPSPDPAMQRMSSSSDRSTAPAEAVASAAPAQASSSGGFFSSLFGGSSTASGDGSTSSTSGNPFTSFFGSSSPATSGNNSAPSGGTSYFELGSFTTHQIPAGHTLYRDGAGGRLRVVALSGLGSQASTGDRPGAGDAGCSENGVGVVTPECEKKRSQTKNAFLDR